MDTASLKDLTEDELQKRWDEAVAFMEKKYRSKLVKWVTVGAFGGFAGGILAGIGIIWVNGGI